VRGADAMRRALGLARPLSDVVWDMEIEGKAADTPERRASLQRAVEHRVSEIVDPVVRDYYRTEMRGRFRRLWQPEPSAGRSGERRPFPGSASQPAPFAAGVAARRAGSDLDGSRQERALLGALLERPALLHVLAEELADLPIANSELARLRRGLLDALALAPSGVDPAADEALTEGADGIPDLEIRLIEEHLERSGLGQAAASAREKARVIFRSDPADPESWVGQWRRAADHLGRLTADPQDLKRAEEALAEDLNEENLRRLGAVLDRIRRPPPDSGAA
jgi:DNA primase